MKEERVLKKSSMLLRTCIYQLYKDAHNRMYMYMEWCPNLMKALSHWLSMQEVMAKKDTTYTHVTTSCIYVHVYVHAHVHVHFYI